MFNLVGFYGISTIVGDLMQILFIHIHILDIYNLVWLGFDERELYRNHGIQKRIL